MSAPTGQQFIPPHSWTQLLQKLVPASTFLPFSKSEVLSLFNSASMPKFKQLVQLLPYLCSKYQQNCQYFRQFLLLLYLLLLKGYAQNQQGKYFMNICLNFLEQFLRYRVLVIVSMWESNILPQLVVWWSQWLVLFVPAVLALMSNNKKQQKNLKDKQLNSQSQDKTIIGILQNLNKKTSSYQHNQTASSTLTSRQQYNPISLIFQSLFIHRIRVHLSSQSLFQFDSILRKVYSPQKFKLIYQGRGCVSHLSNKDKDNEERSKDLRERNVVQLSGLVPARIDQLGWKLCDIQINEQQTKKSKLQLKKIQSKRLMQQWVVEAFENIKPQPMRVSFSTLLNKMKIMQIYRFLCNLQIYGSSPNIQVLNEFIADEKLLEFFTKFLLGQNLAESAFDLMNCKSKENNMGISYSYRNQKFMRTLQFCMNQALKLNIQAERNLLIEEFKSKIIATTKNNNIGCGPNSNGYSDNLNNGLGKKN